ncbi:MAG: hypothetical protein OXH06_13575 [Gemmatimonadetes bacterium]|nr:hypothetical protein [Gemmatimonadota bacterium]MDE3256958.1 hypothetical protein [Gemmatimonadota bacterium]
MSLDIWMFIGRIDAFEEEGADHILDRLEEVGIDTIVLGDLRFGSSPAYPPTPELYSGCETRPPELAPGDVPRFETLQRAVERAKDRNFGVYLHDWLQSAPGCINDPEKLRYGPARTRDVVRSFPGVDGFILDGPEWGYEIAPDHRGNLFRCDCDCCRARAAEWGYDFDVLWQAQARLKDRLRTLGNLPPGRRERGLIDGLDALISNPGLFDWFRFKTDSIENYVSAFADTARSLEPPRRVACGPRLPAFAPLTGYNFGRLAEIVDFQCPKLYFWQHGIDGLKGTVYRWAKTLCAWNPGITEPEALDRVRELFALWVPGAGCLADLDAPLPPEFFEQVALSEINKMRERLGDVSRIRPWMGLHHGGVRMDSGELEHLLQTVEQGGLTTLIYWHYNDMTESDWRVVQELVRS